MLNWLNEKNSIVIVNDETFREERSYKINPSVIYAILMLFISAVAILTILIMIFTPVGNLLPERRNLDTRNELKLMYMHIDSLENAISERDLYFNKLKSLIFEQFEYESDVEDPSSKEGNLTVNMPDKNDELLELIENVENEEQLGNLLESTFHKNPSIQEMIFIPPLTGMVSDTFLPEKGHYGVDIVAPKGSHIKSIQKGTVIVSTFSVETGHMIGIQHNNNVISFCKHNSANLKKVGDIVSAGEVVAIIGNSGELSSGPHLHFELWFNGQAINPQSYMNFEN